MTGGPGEPGSEHAAAAGKLNAARRWFSSKLLVEWLLCAIGAAIIVLLQSLGLPTEDDAAADALMRYHVGVTQERPAYPFAFIAVDEDSFARWNEPLITPRDKLADIVAFALRSKAKLIFLDIELTRLQDGTPVPQEFLDGDTSAKCEQLVGSGDATKPAGAESGDTKLCKVLTQPDLKTPIILARTIVSAGDSASGGQRRMLRRSFLDPILRHRPGVYLASPLYAIDEDRLIRRGRLWELVCTGKGTEPGVLAIPSVELLTAALLDGSETKLIEKMQRIPERYGYSDCLDPPPDRHSDDPLKLRLSNGRIFDIGPWREAARNRIIYSIEWSSRQSRLYGGQLQRAQTPRVIMMDDGETDLITTIPAWKIAEIARPSDQVDGDKSKVVGTDAQHGAGSMLEGHIVVIGATHSQAGDLHETPVGMMPGAVIIMNAINSFQQYGQTSELAWWMTFLLSLVIITVSVFVYHVLWAMIALFVVPLVSFAIAFVLNVSFVHYGMWIDATIPALIYSTFKTIHYYVVELHARAKERRRPGGNWVTPWLRALLH